MVKFGSSLERSLRFGCNNRHIRPWGTPMVKFGSIYDLGAPPRICMVKFGSSLERSLRFGCNKRHIRRHRREFVWLSLATKPQSRAIHSDRANRP